jgi:acetyl-CoA carboxylase biotin carboxylase subunit
MGRLHRVLVANRGEIAVRIIRACYDEGLETVLAVSEADRGSLGAQLADRVVCIGPASPSESYLDIDRLVAAAKVTDCDALHPGVVFVGPSEEAMRRSGDKATARALATELGVAVGQGTDVVDTEADARAAAESIGYPVLLKAAGGGGGRGMRLVERPDELGAAWASASAEAGQAFGDARIFVERYVRHARHVEVQVLADADGRVVHLGHRDCTLQRRYQKLIEEAPAHGLSDALAGEILDAATRLIGALDYQGAATCEFLVDADRGTYGFLEINARLQVEHPVTEMVSGRDVVREQLRIAAGEGLSFEQDDVEIHGHAVEVRINAESPERGFQPTPGTLTTWAAPIGSDVRVDSACFPGWTITPYYDSLLAKVIARGPDRGAALDRARHALRHLRVEGVSTTAGFALDILAEPDVIAGSVHTRWLEEEFLPRWTARPEAA